MISMKHDLRASRRRFFRDELRDARAVTLKDAENFSGTIFSIERLGSFLYGSIGDLGKYREHLATVAKESPLYEHYGRVWGVCFDSLYRLLKEARNDSMHIGAFARHAASNSVMLSLLFEDALMSNATTLNDFMVSDPVCAALWQPLGLIRQKMLANSFSFLPFEYKESKTGWGLISDSQLAAYLRGISNNERGRRLATSLQSAIEESTVNAIPARCMPTQTDVTELKGDIGQQPVLLFDGDDRKHLIGIVTAFDLL